MSTVEPIPVVRAAYLNLVIDILREAHLDGEIALQDYGLPNTLTDRPNGYVPLRPVLAFAQWAARRLAERDFGAQIVSCTRLAHLEPWLRDAVQRAPTLGAALRLYCNKAEREHAPVQCALHLEGDEVRIGITSGIRLPADADGRWLLIAPVLAVIRHFAGRDWTPTVITFGSQGAPKQDGHSACSSAASDTGGETAWITIPAGLLQLTAVQDPRWREVARVPGRQSACPGESGWDFPGSLKEVLRAYLDDGHPSIGLAAEIAGTTVRTLQRRLADYGLTYSDVLTQARFAAAKHLLRDRRVKVTDAAYALGYSDPGPFYPCLQAHGRHQPSTVSPAVSCGLTGGRPGVSRFACTTRRAVELCCTPWENTVTGRLFFFCSQVVWRLCGMPRRSIVVGGLCSGPDH